jgi:triacylglycerol lipase
MLARLQRFTTLGLLLAASAWAAVFIARDEALIAWGGALAIVFGHAGVLAIEFTLLWFVNRADPAPRATLLQMGRAWAGEVVTAPRVFCWRQPFRSRAVPDFLPAGGQRRGVVLVHGYVCNRGLWNPMMVNLRARGVPFVAVNLEPVFGSIDAYVGIIDAAVRRMSSATGLAPVIVAHSMGGLAVRAWQASSESEVRPHRVVTIGSPHAGTFLARFGHTPNAQQMRLGHAWQRHLRSHEPPERFGQFTCFYGHCDNIVFPASTATLPGADNRHVPACAHVHMAHHAEVLSEVFRWVDSVAAPDLAIAGEQAAR